MKSRSLKSLIKKIRNDLDWPILEQTHDFPMIRIVSDPRRKMHTFLMPGSRDNRSTDFDYFHELGHATFCEKVHPVFAANSQFSIARHKKQFLPVIPALNTACDWFIGEWQIKAMPEKTEQQIRENMPMVEEVLAGKDLPPLEIILDASLLVAQAIHYLKEDIECEGVLKTVVDAFLSVPPNEPDADSCALLVNRLMATYTDQRTRLIREDSVWVWDVYDAGETAASQAVRAETQAATA